MGVRNGERAGLSLPLSPWSKSLLQMSAGFLLGSFSASMDYQPLRSMEQQPGTGLASKERQTYKVPFGTFGC